MQGELWSLTAVWGHSCASSFSNGKRLHGLLSTEPATAHLAGQQEQRWGQGVSRDLM